MAGRSICWRWCATRPGQPLPGATVNFTTQLGTLDSAGGLVATNSAGEATDTLIVRARDVNATTAGSFEVGVEVPKSDGTLLVRTRSITIEREPTETP